MKNSLSMLVLGCALVAPSVSLAAPPLSENDPSTSVLPSTKQVEPLHLSLYGTELCLFGRPLGHRCDLVLGEEVRDAASPSFAAPRRFSVFGRDLCVGASEPDCWISWPSTSANAAPGQPNDDGLQDRGS